MSHAPKVIVGALLIVAGANAWMISNAVSHPSAPASTDHWQESLRTNEAIAKREASAALGWRVRLDACAPASAGDRCLARALVMDESGEAVPVRGGKLTFMRADSTAYDRDLVVEAGGATGELTGEWKPAVPGLYTVEMELRGEGDAAWSQTRSVRIEGKLK